MAQVGKSYVYKVSQQIQLSEPDVADTSQLLLIKTRTLVALHTFMLVYSFLTHNNIKFYVIFVTFGTKIFN
jgi:hypothetical protein